MEYIPYPNIDDKKFTQKLMNKYEFLQNKTDGSLQNQEDACSKGLFRLFKHQRFLSNFFNPLTPYRSLLLFNALGSGKSCSSITIAEQHKKQITSLGQRIVVLMEAGLMENYMNELYNPDNDDNQCIGNTYNRPNRRKAINEVYDLISIDTFVGIVNKALVTQRTDALKKRFSNTLIIVDEVHNLRERETDDTLKRYDALAKVLELSENTKLLLMSATPMFDNPREIVSLLNLFKINEKHKKLVDNDDVFTKDDILTKRGDKILRHEFKGRVSYVGQNPNTFPSFGFASNATNLKILDILKVIKCPMSKRQYEMFLKEDDMSGIRKIGNILPGHDKKDLLIGQLKNDKSGVSTKFAKLYDNIIDAKGPAFVFSEFLSSGVIDVKKMLIANGFIEYKRGKEKRKSFIVLDGEVSLDKRQKLLNAYNSIDNKDGSIIKVIIGSPVMKEGVSLKNTRSVHILEPWHNVSRLKQIWGRAIRSCSHVSLKPSERHVDIYLYASTFPTGVKMMKPKNFSIPYPEVKNKISYDLYAYKRSEEKEKKIKPVVHILRETAIDCNLHAELNNNKKDNIKCEPVKQNMEQTTYNLDELTFNAALLSFVIKVIKHEIRKNYQTSIPKLLKLKILKEEDVDKNLLKQAIKGLIPSKQTDFTSYKHFLQIKDQVGYIILRGEQLVFQPLDDAMKKRSKREFMSMFERMNPKSRQFKDISFEKDMELKDVDEDVMKQKKQLAKLKTKEVKIIRDDVIKSNIQGILKSNGELLLLQQLKGKDTIDLRKKSRGRICNTFNGADMLKLVKTIGMSEEQYEHFFLEKDGKIRVKDKATLCIIIREFFYPDVNLPSPVSSSASSSTSKKEKRTRKGEENIMNTKKGKYIFRIVISKGKELFKIGRVGMTDRGSKNCSVKKKEDLIAIAQEFGLNVNMRMTRVQICNMIREHVFKPTPK